MFFVRGKIVTRQFCLCWGFQLHLDFLIWICPELFLVFLASFCLGSEVSSKKFSTYASNQFVSKDSIESMDMTGKYALVLWRDKIIGKKEVYLYALCTGMEDNPLGFYFKWLQYKNADDQLDHSFYKDSEWKIKWLKNKLSAGDLRSLDTFGCIPLLTGYVQLN